MRKKKMSGKNISSSSKTTGYSYNIKLYPQPFTNLTANHNESLLATMFIVGHSSVWKL
jgi:hypothetical protein